MAGLLRNLSGCLTLLFVGALGIAAAIVLLRPAAPLPDAPIEISRQAPGRADSSPPSAPSTLPAPDKAAPPASSDASAPEAAPRLPEHRHEHHPGRRREPAAPSRPADESTGSNESPPRVASSVVPNVTVRDREGRIVYEGPVDLGPTLARVAAGQRLDFPDDGIVFQNRERRLPARPAGYYREYALPTAGLPGPGPQRVVIGEAGDVHYTPDHYRTFRSVR